MFAASSSLLTRARIVGIGQTPIGKLNTDSTTLALQSMALAVSDANMKSTDIDGLVAMPSLSSQHFMQAHYLATKADMLKANPNVLLRTLDTGGAGPISAITTAVNFLENGFAKVVAIVCTDAVHTLPSKEFGERSNSSIPSPDLPEPHIPHAYDRYAQWQMKKYGLTREQLAMVPVLMSAMAARHPDAMCREPYTLEQVLGGRPVAPVTTLLECARRADGAVTMIISDEDHYRANFLQSPAEMARKPRILSTGEGSGPVYPPPMDDITPELFSCHRAADFAYKRAGLSGAADIDFFGLYDCFPICFIRALESVGLCGEGEGGRYVERAYKAMLANKGTVNQNAFPINTHGGLMCFGAPWEVPAAYNVAEAVAQLSGAAGARQITPTPKRALCYGNGGVFSASSVVILESN